MSDQPVARRLARPLADAAAATRRTAILTNA
jgi:hypothetical protein